MSGDFTERIPPSAFRRTLSGPMYWGVYLTPRERLRLVPGSIYTALPEWPTRIVDAVLHRFGIHGLTCRGVPWHKDPSTGRWI